MPPLSQKGVEGLGNPGIQPEFGLPELSVREFWLWL